MGMDLDGLRAAAVAAESAPLPSTERILAWQSFEDAADPTAVLALLDRVAAADAAVERVRALADEWESVGRHDQAARRAHGKLRAAIDGDS